MNSFTCKIAVVGCGNWGKNLARVFNHLGVLGAICDSDPVKAAQFSQDYEVPDCHFEDLCNNPNITGLVLATPSWTHFDLAQRALQAKKHVFIEKPLTISLETSERLQQIATQNQCVLMVGHLLQYHPVFNQLKALVQQGVLGKLHYLSSSRCNFGKFISERSVLWDFAPHDISMVLSLVGMQPSQVTAKAGHYLQHTVVDNVSMHIDFPNHINAHIFSSWMHPFKEQKLIVVGDKGMAVFDDTQAWEHKLRLFPYPDDWHDGLPRPLMHQGENVVVEKAEPLRNECEHFLHCILSKQTPLTNGDEAVRVMAVLEAAEQSIQQQKSIALTDNVFVGSNVSEKELAPA